MQANTGGLRKLLQHLMCFLLLLADLSMIEISCKNEHEKPKGKKRELLKMRQVLSFR